MGDSADHPPRRGGAGVARPADSSKRPSSPGGHTTSRETAPVWRPDNPHPLSRIKAELIWEGKIDEYGCRRLARERRTVEAMIRLYCRAVHGGQALCPACRELLAYAQRRLERCPFRAHKPTCARCPVHCYRPEMRGRIRAAMRYAGPRMLWRHPLLTLRHLLDGLRRPPPG